MGATKNIEMREFNGVDYDLLLPKTDAYTRNETLTNYTKNILNLSSDAVPDDAFIALALGQGTYGYRIKVQLKDGTPVEGANISGIQSLVGNSLITGTDGIVLGKSTNASVNISCTSPFVDQKSPNSIVVQKTGIITDYTITLINVEDMLTFPYSKSVKVSHVAKSMDITAVGRGGGGGAPRQGNRGNYTPSYGSTGQPASYGSRGKGCKGNNYSISADQGRDGVVYVLFHF